MQMMRGGSNENQGEIHIKLQIKDQLTAIMHADIGHIPPALTLATNAFV
jgi:hypothetical protein